MPSSRRYKSMRPRFRIRYVLWKVEEKRFSAHEVLVKPETTTCDIPRRVPHPLFTPGLFPRKGLNMFTLIRPDKNSEWCFQGSTEFYEYNPNTDRATPSYLEAQPLKDNVGKRKDGTIPPWMKIGKPTQSPSERYVEWFNGIWVQGDPSSWNASVFTNNAVTIDPSGVTTGAEESASNFLLLFRYFPELRGEVVSWSANEREIFINWRFRIPNQVKGRLPVGPITQALAEQQGGRDFLVPVCDKFCFVDGRVSFRLAYFDIITLVGYLSNNFSANELYDYLIAFTWKSLTSGGIPLIPKMLINLFLGLFVWPAPPPANGLSAQSGDGIVTLRWPKMEGAVGYKVSRATTLEGPYEILPIGGTEEQQTLRTNIYYDRNVTNRSPYWYLVNPVRPQGATLKASAAISKARKATY